jgi:hypothetical protein
MRTAWAGACQAFSERHYFVIRTSAPVRFRHGEIFSGLLVPIVWPILRRSGRKSEANARSSAEWNGVPATIDGTP